MRETWLDILVANDLTLALYDGIMDEVPRNLARFLFLDDLLDPL